MKASERIYIFHLFGSFQALQGVEGRLLFVNERHLFSALPTTTATETGPDKQIVFQIGPIY